MRKLSIFLLTILALLLVGCDDLQPSAHEVEHAQQEGGMQAMLRNQPVPTLSYSMERQILTELYRARNRYVATWTYTRDIQGHIMEICASAGFPIPYSTQLTNPWQRDYNTAVGNPEPSGLYSPSSAEGTWISCVDSSGAIAPQYWEDRVFATTRRVRSAYKLEFIGDDTSSFSVKVPKK